MTDRLRAAAEAALNALLESDPLGRAGTIQKLRAALAEPEAEPHELTCVCGRVWSISDGKEELVS